MAKLNLTEKGGRVHKEFEPVTLSDGTTVSVVQNTEGDTVLVEGDITKEGKEKPVGRYQFDEKRGRFFVNVCTDAMSRKVVREMVDTLSQVLLSLTE